MGCDAMIRIDWVILLGERFRSYRMRSLIDEIKGKEKQRIRHNKIS